MGKITQADLVMAGIANIDKQLKLHFKANFFPAIPDGMIEPAKQAIELVQQERGTEEIELPAGTTFQYKSTVPAYILIDTLRLESWIIGGE